MRLEESKFLCDLLMIFNMVMVILFTYDLIYVRYEETIKSMQEFDKKFENFKKQFSDVLGKFAEKAFGSLTPSANLNQIQEESEYEPRELNAIEAGKMLSEKKHILVLTGAGLSAASGIPTFRGSGGFWTKKYAGCKRPEDLATRKFFEEQTEAKWTWTHDFIDLINSKKPNEGHEAILKLQEFCSQNDVKCDLVTQNIDSYHSKLIKESKVLSTKNPTKGSKDYGFTSHVHEIHGNIKYMRCFEECNLNLYDIPPLNEKDDIIPKCTSCGSKMRPHVLWFDESYSERLYHLNTVQDILDKFTNGSNKSEDENSKYDPEDYALVVVGTALATNLANRIVMSCLKKDVLTIEVNLVSCLQAGNVVKVLGKSEEVLPELIDIYIDSKK